MRIRITLCFVLLLITLLTVPATTSAQVNLEATAGDAAVLISQYEEGAYLGYFYGALHIDAKVLIPAPVIFGWYNDVYFPNGPRAITVTNVEIKPWTWEVTGVTYPVTAEVRFTQPFDNGETVEDVMRLVERNGAWFWFFGRTQEFVNVQISQYAPHYPLLDETAGLLQVTGDAAPWDLETLTEADAQSFQELLPAAVLGHRLRDTRLEGTEEGFFPAVIQETLIAVYVTPPERIIPSGEVHLMTLFPGVRPAAALDAIASGARSAPHFIVHHESRSGSVYFMLVEVFADDAVGNIPILLWGRRMELNSFLLRCGTASTFAYSLPP
jgi:hypothetical protein